MNKNQLTMAVIGGVALVAVLAFAYLTYSTVSEREEAEMSLQANKQAFEANRRFGAKEAESIRRNVEALKTWANAAYGEAGSLSVAEMSPDEFSAKASEFQQQMRADVNRYRRAKLLPDDVTAAYAAFVDFKDYLAGRFPDRPGMVREWNDICLFADALVAAGSDGMLSVRVETPERPPEPEARGPGRRGGAQAEKPDPIDARVYNLVFLARPGALVDVLNRLSKAERFVSIDELAFAQEPDPLLGLLTGGEKKDDEEASRGRRGRRRRNAAAEAQPEAETDEEKILKGKVTDPADPLVCKPFKVTMKISTLTVRSEKEEAK